MFFVTILFLTQEINEHDPQKCLLILKPGGAWKGKFREMADILRKKTSPK